jgi:hypothetical protein
MAMSLKKAERGSARRNRQARQRAAQYQRACARARETLTTSGWQLRPGAEAGLVAERPVLTDDGSFAPPRRVYGQDELAILKQAVKQESAWLS